MKVSCEITGGRLVEAHFDALAHRALTLQATAFPAIREDFQALEARRFGDEGPGWAPLSPVTIEIKKRRKNPQPESILYATGRMLFSLTGNNADTVYEATLSSLLIGTKTPYAQYHQYGPRQIRVFGGPTAWLPQRKVVDIGPDDAARWAAILAAALIGGRR